MKKVILIMMLAGSASLFQACNTGNSSKDAADSVKNLGEPVNPIDTSKTTTTLGSATVVDNSGSGGTTIIKGRASNKTTMETPASTAAKTDTAATAHKDSVKTKL
jgi:hypothetical protein